MILPVMVTCVQSEYFICHIVVLIYDTGVENEVSILVTKEYPQIILII